MLPAQRALPADTLASPPPRASADSGAPRLVAGRVVRPRGRQLEPVRGVWATIHRVGRDGAGPLDSARTGGDGRYTFRYRPFGSDDAIYFVSAMYAGIAYFTPPLGQPVVRDESAEITVFDTTSGPLPIHVRGHHYVLSAPHSDGRREMLEVLELSNDSSLTLIGVGETGATFSAPLAAGAADFRIGTGDVTADAAAMRGGRVAIFAPFAPGLKQISYSYTLPASAFPLRLPLERPTVVLEALVEDTAGTATGAGLREVAPVTVEGRSFRRFQSDDVPAGAVIVVDVPRVSKRDRGVYLAAVAVGVGAAMLVALARAFKRPASTGPVTIHRASAVDTAEQLARVIADLDASFESIAAPTPAQREEHAATRAELKARLAAALAREGAST